METLKNFFKSQSTVCRYTRKFIFGVMEWAVLLLALWSCVFITDIIFDINIIFNDILKLSAVIYFVCLGALRVALLIMIYLKNDVENKFNKSLEQKFDKYIKRD